MKRANFVALIIATASSAVVLALPRTSSSITVAVPRNRTVTLGDFAANWVIMTCQSNKESAPVWRLHLVNGHIIGSGAGGSGQVNLWQLKGHRLTGNLLINTNKIPLSIELNSDKGQLIIIAAPPQSEYDVALAWRAGYSPTMQNS